MRKRFGIVLAVSLIATVASAVWPFGMGSQKPITNETLSVSGPVPRVSPRVFSDHSGQERAVVQQRMNGKNAMAHQHSSDCACAQTNRAAKAVSAKQHPMFDRSEEEMQKVIKSGEAGNLRSAYLMWQYYSRHQDATKTEQWREKTRQLAEKEEAFAKQILQRLNKPEEGSVSDNR